MLSAVYSSRSSGVSAFLLLQLGVLFREGVGDEFQEDEAKDNVFVFGGVEVAAQLVSGGPKGGFEAEVRAGGLVLLVAFHAWHLWMVANNWALVVVSENRGEMSGDALRRNSFPSRTASPMEPVPMQNVRSWADGSPKL